MCVIFRIELMTTCTSTRWFAPLHYHGKLLNDMNIHCAWRLQRTVPSGWCRTLVQQRSPLLPRRHWSWHQPGFSCSPLLGRCHVAQDQCQTEKQVPIPGTDWRSSRGSAALSESESARLGCTQQQLTVILASDLFCCICKIKLSISLSLQPAHAAGKWACAPKSVAPVLVGPKQSWA
jgi:hypothetical protein